jgi:hypothetical protein
MSYQPFTELPENATQQVVGHRAPVSDHQPFQPGFHAPILHLQRVLGNQRVGELIQAKA